jgi:hypothetical protein
VDEYRMRFNASVAGANSTELDNNYVSMKFDSDWMEEFYGLGLQYSDWNMKGKQVPLITTEGGVGRGLQPITAFTNKFSHGGGGIDTQSYAPAAQWITNKRRGMIFDSLKIGYADFEDPDRSEVLHWHDHDIAGTMFWGEDFMHLSQILSQTVGTMRPLPSWVLQGSIVGIVNGEDYVREQYAKMKNLGLPMVGIWMQDWVGQHDFPEGTRLLWNW